jgi:ribosomal protein S18 acetylase RimI-like enzyme
LKNITYRPADKIKDFEFGKQLHHAAYHDVVVRQFRSWDETLQSKFFEEDWNSTPHKLVLLNETPIGVVSSHIAPDHIFLAQLQILPEYQGQGIGSIILRTQMELAAQANLPLRLRVLKANRAQELYLRSGFKKTSSSETHLNLEWACQN